VNDPHAAAPDAPSPVIGRWIATRPPGAALDVAAGGGRHARLLSQTAATGSSPSTATSPEPCSGSRPPTRWSKCVAADLEGGPWPLAGTQRSTAVVVSNYLWRPLLPDAGRQRWRRAARCCTRRSRSATNASGGRGTRTSCCAPGELLEAVRGELEVRAYRARRRSGHAAERAVRQRLFAVRAR
jgi:hypothetical protein